MKPKVICHIMSSVDGRLLPSRWTPPFDNTPASALFGEYARLGKELDTDAWMFGLSTAQEGVLPYKFVGKKTEYTMPKKPYIDLSPRKSTRMFIVSDPAGRIFYHTSSVRGDNIGTILGENVTDEYLQHLQTAHISYVFGGKDGYDMETALETLGNLFDIKSISLQGGGVIDGAMLAAGLIDELSLVIYPGIDGKSGIPSIFEYIGNADLPAQGQSLELKTVGQCSHGVVWLRYKIRNNQRI